MNDYLDPYPMVTTVGRHARNSSCYNDLDCLFSPREGFSKNEDDYEVIRPPQVREGEA